MSGGAAIEMTGEVLAAMLHDAAKLKGVPIRRFLAPLTPDPPKWLAQLETARRPKATTIARIEALISGRTLPEPCRKITAHATGQTIQRLQEIATARGITIEVLIGEALTDWLEWMEQ